MVNIRGREQQPCAGAAAGSPSPRGEVGEIDTAAPFQSVKAAVSLFGEVALSKKPTIRRSRVSSENVLDKETQLVLAQREIDRYKKQLESSENTRGRASSELTKARRTLHDLTSRLKTVMKSKLSAMEAAEAVKDRAKKLEVEKMQNHEGNSDRNQELDSSREQYKISASQLVVLKQQLNKMRQDFNAALEQKLAAFQQAAEAQRSTNLNTERAAELSREIKAMKESAQQLKIAAAQAQELQVKNSEEKDAHVQAIKTAKEVALKTLERMKEEYDPELTENLEVRLAETSAEIETLQEEMKKVHASEMEAVKVITAELKQATKLLQLVVEEENSIRHAVTSLRIEVENVKREQAELLEKEVERLELAYQEQCSALENLSSEAEIATREAEEVRKNEDMVKQEAEDARLKAEQAEEKLQLLLNEAEMAKEAERKARDDMKILSEKTEDDGQDNCTSNSRIKISMQEFDSLKRKEIECENMAERKEAATMAHVETINAMKNDAEKKLEANLKAIEEIKQATHMALRSAEMAEAAQIVVESDLKRWRQEEEEQIIEE